MLLVAAILSIGLLLGWGLGGAPRNLGRVRIRLWPAALVGLALQALPIPLERTFGRLAPFGVIVLSYALLLVVVAVNHRLRGFFGLGLGLLLNAVVIVANQGMPVSESSLRRVGQAEAVERLTTAEDPKHHLATEDDVLLPLADVIPVGSPFHAVVSLGDALSYVGAASFLTAAMLGRPERPRLEGAVRRREGPREGAARPAATATRWGTPQ